MADMATTNLQIAVGNLRTRLDKLERNGTERGQAHDLDETRRLLYMALLARHTKRYNLAGTLVNALKHHSKVDEPVDAIVEQVLACIEDRDPEADAWVNAQIVRITTALDG